MGKVRGEVAIDVAAAPGASKSHLSFALDHVLDTNSNLAGCVLSPKFSDMFVFGYSLLNSTLECALRLDLTLDTIQPPMNHGDG